MKDIKILISSLLIFTSFFLGIAYEKTSSVHNQENKKEFYVNLVQKSNGFDILKNSDDIHILINGKQFSGTGISLEKKVSK